MVLQFVLNLTQFHKDHKLEKVVEEQLNWKIFFNEKKHYLNLLEAVTLMCCTVMHWKL